LRRYGLADAVRVTLDGTRVSLEIAENILFAPGQADLTAEGRKLLGRLGPVLPATGSAVTVEGHTDSQPIATARFPSNWELSAARAAAVGRALLDLGLPPARLMVAGRADTRPLADNAREDGRARNRRVNILLEP
jgi:chemotaxis protein MotB